MVTENIIPTPTTLPPQAAPQPSMEADVWAGQAEVVLASLSSQLDAVAQAEAAWLGLPEDRRAHEPDAVQALKDRKALLEQQRATLMSQLEALRALPDRTTELTSAQAQLDAVERTLRESTSTAASPDYQEALRQLEEQREMRRQQRDHAAQALADLRSGVEEALSAPLPAEKDKDGTTKVVERVKAVVEGRPDPGDQDDDPEHDAADDQEPASNQRREDEGEERDDTGTTAPPDPERPSVPDVLAGGAGELGFDGGGTSPDPGSGNGDTDPAPTDNATHRQRTHRQLACRQLACRQLACRRGGGAGQSDRQPSGRSAGRQRLRPVRVGRAVGARRRQRRLVVRRRRQRQRRPRQLVGRPRRR